MRFTESKFKGLKRALQEKKCSEAIRLYLEGALSLGVYLQFLDWMGEKKPGQLSENELSDRYHLHLTAAGLSHKEHNLLQPKVRKLDRKEAASPLPVTIYLDRIRSAHNVGSIIRTMEAFSLGKLAISNAMADPTHKQVKDAAMGAEQWVEWERMNLSEISGPLIAIETSPEATPLQEFQFPESFTLALGNEEFGLSDEILQRADHLVEIPLYGRKNSLNVANCFAIIAAHIRGCRE